MPPPGNSSPTRKRNSSPGPETIAQLLVALANSPRREYSVCTIVVVGSTTVGSEITTGSYIPNTAAQGDGGSSFWDSKATVSGSVVVRAASFWGDCCNSVNAKWPPANPRPMAAIKLATLARRAMMDLLCGAYYAQNVTFGDYLPRKYRYCGAESHARHCPCRANGVWQ